MSDNHVLFNDDCYSWDLGDGESHPGKCTPGCAVAELDRQSGILKTHGGASRFFYCAKASKSEKNTGCEGLAKRVASVGNLESAGRDGSNPKNAYGTGTKNRIEKGLSPTEPRANHHPTVKPTKLMTYLIRMITPPKGIVLDPFMGSGSTGVAAVKEGFQFIGIEKELEYFTIAEKRIGHVDNGTVDSNKEAS